MKFFSLPIIASHLFLLVQDVPNLKANKCEKYLLSEFEVGFVE